ncbi:MAG: homoserine dehydrogenase [Gammaproteobacteria bacterium]|nr:homoserine dehydrogenase [Gammaproteobacteria bacterium]
MGKPLRVGMCGLGTVAQGVLNVLRDNHDAITQRAGREIQLTQIASRSLKAGVDLGSAEFCTDVLALSRRDDLDVVVELIGGEETALEIVRNALRNGTSVVTGNKAIMALHGNELVELAREQGCSLGFEAAVAGAIPIIAALTRSLAGNQVGWLAGIINGTSNFILTAMTEEGQNFQDALEEAQRLGYAEADPTVDVDGIDAAHKLTILAALAFDMGFRFSDVYTEGISGVTAEDIEYADQLGYRIKHLGITRRTEAGVEARVHPTLVPKRQLIANINGVMNAVLVQGNAAGPTLFCGAGAGDRPSASAVIADLVEMARGIAFLPVKTPNVSPPMLAVEDTQSAFYLRIPSLDQPGVFAKVAGLLSERDISIEAAIQREQAIDTTSQQAWVPIIILTHVVNERVMNDAVAAVQSLPEVVGQITRLRVDQLTDG